jgi:hypothetical protein
MIPVSYWGGGVIEDLIVNGRSNIEALIMKAKYLKSPNPFVCGDLIP